MTNEQLYLAVGVPVIINIAFNGFMFMVLNNRISRLEGSLKEMCARNSGGSENFR